MLTCKDASRLVSEGQDRKLSLGERLGLRLHLWMCVHCRRFERQIQLLRRALQRLDSQAEVFEQTSTLSIEASDRIRNAIADRRGHTH